MATILPSNGGFVTVTESAADASDALRAGERENDAMVQLTQSGGNPVFINPAQVCLVQ